LGSVLILFYRDNGELFFPLIKRTDYKGLHSGQISLPGGKKEGDETDDETAIRETHEEIGVDPAHIKVIGHLSRFHVIPSNFIVTPIVASIDHKPKFIPDPREVNRIIQVNLSDLIHKDAIFTSEILAAGKFKLNAPHFLVEQEIVWGATAMMLNELRIITQEILGK
jgi:8-oxo-dGTP pyrophosphatase MutT (NUDIX family)